ncbi:hypothetical protein DVH24_012830, partial [Malus domestica]
IQTIFVTSRLRSSPHPGLYSTVARYCSLWAPTTPHDFWVTHYEIALARTHLTSEFLRNPKLMSSQKASCFRPGSCSDTKLSHPDLGPHHIPDSTPP